jgi:hypothetical protein
MAEAASGGDVVRALEDLAGRLDFPAGGDLSGPVRAALAEPGAARRPSVPRWLIPALAAAVVAVAVAVVLVVPDARQAVARWLGLGGVEVTQVEEVPDDIGFRLDLGRRSDLEAAVASAGFDVRLPADLGDPEAVFVGRPTGAVTAVWAPSDDLPEVGDSGVGLLLTQFPATTDEALVEKELGRGTSIEAVTVAGQDGFWITGAPHTVTYVGPDGGEPERDPIRLAGNTLVWVEDGVTHRLESALDRDAAIALAESLEPAG